MRLNNLFKVLFQVFIKFVYKKCALNILYMYLGLTPVYKLKKNVFWHILFREEKPIGDQLSGKLLSFY